VESRPHIPRTLGLTDLVLLSTVAIVNVNVVPPVGVFGRATLGLWMLAWLAFFVPSAIAVLALSKRYPGEGGVYLWARQHFGDLHGFVSGWCYWTNNLFYVPVLLVYLAGVVAFAGGPRTAGLVDEKWFVGTVAFGWLALITAANIRGWASASGSTTSAAWAASPRWCSSPSQRRWPGGTAPRPHHRSSRGRSRTWRGASG
jgi:amino acid transporter